MALKVGDRVTVKPEPWARVFNTTYPPSETEVVGKISRNAANTRNVYYLTSFPGIWWDENDLICLEPEYEKVDSVFVNKHTVKVGYKFRCRCDYEVTALHPIRDKNGKHLPDHPSNNFHAILKPSEHCPIHAKCKAYT